MSDDSWTRNPALSGIDPVKLQTLISLADQAKGKNPNELLPFLMAAVSKPQDGNMAFQSSEVDAIIEVMKIGKSPEEVQRIDRLCTLMKQFRK